MKRTLGEVKALMDDWEVKFVRLCFCDIFGSLKNIAIMADQLEDALEYGVSFDASSVEGFGKVNESDLLLHPDLDTFAILPWRPAQRSVARFYCSVSYPDGRPFEGDGRRILSDAVSRAAEGGYSFLIGPECEFYLFETDERGEATLRPFDRAGYFDLAPLDRGENVRRDICFALEELGIVPQRSHHESGPGQNEIDFSPSAPLAAADDYLTFKMAVKAIASSNGLFASFLPKPLKEESGSGLHVNISVHRNGDNLFAKDLEEGAGAFMAGILEHIKEITVFLNPLPGSYDRLGAKEAPSLVSWSRQNRSSLVRLPFAMGRSCRMELRSPDCACNPYFAFSLLLAAGMEGLEKSLVLGASYDQDSNSKEAHSLLSGLPTNLGEAVEETRASAFVRSVLPERTLDSFLSLKERQWVEYSGSADRDMLERRRYFEHI